MELTTEWCKRWPETSMKLRAICCSAPSLSIKSLTILFYFIFSFLNEWSYRMYLPELRWNLTNMIWCFFFCYKEFILWHRHNVENDNVYVIVISYCITILPIVRLKRKHNNYDNIINDWVMQTLTSNSHKAKSHEDWKKRSSSRM